MALEKFEEYEEIKELYNLRKNEIKQYKLIETYQKIIPQREYTKIEKKINKKFRDEYEKKINYLVKSNNKKIKKKLEELKKLKENNNIGTIGSIINIFKSIGKKLPTNFPLSIM